MQFKDANFSFETSQLGGTPGGDLVVMVTPVAPATFNVSDYAVLAIPLFTDVGVDQVPSSETHKIYQRTCTHPHYSHAHI